MPATLTKPSALFQLASHIQTTGCDSESNPITDSEASQVLELLIQQRLLSYEHLNEIIQEALDQVRFSEDAA